MLQRLSSSFDEELSPGDGLWTRAELERMNDCFVQACEVAFQRNLESRLAAAATVRVGYRNGKQAVVESVLEAAWDWLCRERGNVAASQIIAFVRERCPGLDVMRIRLEFDRRFKQRGAEWA
jgi:hypothetical protein